MVDSLVGEIHYGNTPLVRWLRVIPALQAVTALVLLLAAVSIVRTRGNAERERVWAGMARESAHQLGTPLSSLAGWIELLEEARTGDATEHGAAVEHMRADLERLDRVAHRFERIGREPRRDAVDVAALVDAHRPATSARASPRWRSRRRSTWPRPTEPVTVVGDAVLLEWALEVLVKNAVDALAGRGGRIAVSARRRQGGGARASPWPTTGPASRATCAPASSSRASPRSRAAGASASPSRAASSRRTTAARCALASSDRGATFEIILP